MVASAAAAVVAARALACDLVVFCATVVSAARNRKQ
jgi:hypothetical protein